jgi:Tfp pilus assembly protein PilF
MDTYLPPAPQINRASATTDDDDQPGLWSQILAVFRDLSGSFDTFANDANPQVRALGRAARQRRHTNGDDYFSLGDLCARLALQGSQLSEVYAAKAIAAYVRAGEIAPSEARTARKALKDFAHWVVDVARSLGSYDAIKVAILVCDRVQQIQMFAKNQADVEQLRETAQRLREQMTRISEANPGDQNSAALHESQLQCDQGQMLLRQNQTKDALELFERSLQSNNHNHAAWLWRAMALTDLGRFNDALASYDRALAIEPENASVWNSKGALLTELGRADAALECFEHALALAPTAAKVRATFWLNKGKALFILKRYREARDALVRSYQLDPGPESSAGIAACREQLELVMASRPAGTG